MKVIDIVNKYGWSKSQYIFEYLTDLNGKDIYFHLQDILNDEQELKYKEFLVQNESIPLQYIIGFAYFYNRKFLVDENVLIPRMDTEIIIQVLLDKKVNGKILDMCTGSGIIAITMDLETNSQVVGADISKDALNIAKNNQQHLGSHVHWIQSDLFCNIDNTFDFIISNPPYINKEDMDALDQYVKKEPYSALFGGDDGLKFYREIINEAPKYLNDKGYICLEIGYNQGNAVIELLKKSFHEIEIYQDIAGNDRVLIARKK